MFARLGAFGAAVRPGGRRASTRASTSGARCTTPGRSGAALTARVGGISGVAVSQAVQGYGVEGQGWDEMLTGQLWERRRRRRQRRRGRPVRAARRAGSGQPQRPQSAGGRDGRLAAHDRRPGTAAGDLRGPAGTEGGSPGQLPGGDAVGRRGVVAGRDRRRGGGARPGVRECARQSGGLPDRRPETAPRRPPRRPSARLSTPCSGLAPAPPRATGGPSRRRALLPAAGPGP